MLVVSTDHPRSASCLSFAHAQELPTREIDDASEDALFDALSSEKTERVLLALSADVRETALRMWVRLPVEHRAQSVVVLGESVLDDELLPAFRGVLTPRALLLLDHNLSAEETLVWSLQWGAAVPLFETIAPDHDTGLMARARAAARAIKDVRGGENDAPSWRLEGREQRASYGGFALSDNQAPSRVVRELGVAADGIVTGNAATWSQWQAVFEPDCDTVTLRGSGTFVLNGQARRASGTDVLYLRRCAPAAVAMIGMD